MTRKGCNPAFTDLWHFAEKLQGFLKLLLVGGSVLREALQNFLKCFSPIKISFCSKMTVTPIQVIQVYKLEAERLRIWKWSFKLVP